MRYTDEAGNTLNLSDALTADSFFMEAEVYISEPLEMYFNLEGELKAGKRPKSVANMRSDG